ncbi:hypothetical protein [Caballeronia calidae]|uniref:hypothetical protein n=1 Tax=Caballeronia calidae TaxID=1777139 RepID=UPI0012FE4350|nr:hypothetical protein [Caballeronia calidae]
MIAVIFGRANHRRDCVQRRWFTSTLDREEAKCDFVRATDQPTTSLIGMRTIGSYGSRLPDVERGRALIEGRRRIALLAEKQLSIDNKRQLLRGLELTVG